MTKDIDREAYADLYSPSKGDHVRLASTELFAEVETDLRTHGDEVAFGGGKTLRNGLEMTPDATQADEALSWIITNTTVIDPILGVVADGIGIRDDGIVGVDKAGNPDTMDGVDMVVGLTADIYPVEGKITTADTLDVHVRWNSAQLYKHGLAFDITTMLGGGYGGGATTCTISSQNTRRFLQAAEAWPVNVGSYGKGNASTPEPLIEQVEAGTCALKLHEDRGSAPTTIDTCLDMARDKDMQACIHTDTLNKTGFIENTFATADGRTMHLFHIKGAGSGHALDIMELVDEPSMLPSSTNPSIPYTDSTFDEHLGMVTVYHHLSPDMPEDVTFAESRMRAKTIATEDVLHDMGAISMMTTDSQAVGQQAELISRAWQVASKMKSQRGPLPEDEGISADNHHIKRYLAKYTINPAISVGIDDYVGTLEPGKFADMVLWDSVFFGVKPAMIFKGGFPAHSEMGEAGGSLITREPILRRRWAGADGKARYGLSLSLVSPAAADNDVGEAYDLGSRVVPVSGTRMSGKKDMLYSGCCPDDINVDPETFEIEVNGEPVTCEPASELPLT